MSNYGLRRSCAIVAVLLAAGCVAPSQGPTVQVLPSPGKPLALFQQEQAECKAYAADQVGGSAQHANNMQVLTTLGVAAIGAGAGALFGGGRGAAIGAGAGLLGGTAVGAFPVHGANENIQGRYDDAYEQCMLIHGDLLRGHRNAAAY